MWHPAELDPGDGTRTEQVAALIVRRIERGDLAIGSRLPSERVLAEPLGVSRVTVVRALGLLRDDGVLSTRRVRGARAGRSTGSWTRSRRRRRWGRRAARDRSAVRHHGRAAGRRGGVRPAVTPAAGRDGRRRSAAGRVRRAADRAGRRLTASRAETDADQLTATVGAAPGWRPPSPGSTSARERADRDADVSGGAGHLPSAPPRGRRLAGRRCWDPDQLAHLCRRHAPEGDLPAGRQPQPDRAEPAGEDRRTAVVGDAAGTARR